MRKVCELESCGIAFEAKRDDARFHSAGCRAKASRERREAVGPDSGPTRGGEGRGESPDDGDRWGALEQRVAELGADVAALEGMDDVVRDLTRRVGAQEADVRRVVEEAMAPMGRELVAHRSSIRRLHAAMKELEASVETVATRMSSSGLVQSALDYESLVESVVSLRSNLNTLTVLFNDHL